MSEDLQQSRDVPDPPEHLSRKAAGWWADMAREWILSPAERELLTRAAEAIELADDALAELDDLGLNVETNQGGVKRNPAAGVYNDAVTRFYRLIRELDLEEDEAEVTTITKQKGKADG